MKKKRGDGVVRVGDLFSKYKKILKAPQRTVIQACIDAINEVVGVTIDEQQCRYQVHSRTITIAVPSVIKTEIVLKKKLILKHMQIHLGEKNVPKEIF